jgi:hypothetical protein
MTRCLLNLVTALSLLLCVAVCVLWVRSYRVGSVFGYYTERAGDGWYRSYSVGSYAGRITLVPLRSTFDYGLTRGRFHAWDDASKPQPRSEWAGFGYLSVQGRQMGWMEFRVPHWAVLVTAALTPTAMGLRSVRQRHRRRGNICRSCGYDLRASPDRCPECGRTPAGAAA